ncbi:MAG: DUF3322 domain-containing protein, partial [Streptosporangiaceae bacterium]
MNPAAARRPAWVTPADVLRTLRKRWETGAFLTRFASGQPWEPLGLPIRGPAAAELAARFTDAQAWARGWAGTARSFRIEHKQVGGRVIGVNSIPCRAWIDSYEQLWRLLGVEAEVVRFSTALDQAKAVMPALADWMIAHPVKVLALAHDWDRILATVAWIDQSAGLGRYLRQIDVPGVDTKFIEHHRGVLTDLLDLQLPPARIDTTVPRSDFTGRYRFRKKPSYVRFRYLAASPSELSELTIRTQELTVAPPGISTVYVVENEVTYLAFPPVRNAIVIFGGGYAVSVLEQLPWLAGCDLVYWGDIDTHGFEILARLRRHFPHTRSVLMDRATLLAHQTQWVTEPAPARPDLAHLTPDEAALCHDLTTDLYAPS